MKDIELKLGKPYSRDNDVVGFKIEFSALFDDEDKALAFQQSLIQLVRESRS